MDKSSYGPGVYVSTGRSAEGNEPGYGSSHHTWWKRFQFTLSYSQAATKAVSHRAGPRTALCFKVISILPNFCDKQIYFKTSQPPHQLPQNNSEVIRKSVTWKTLQDSGTYFFFFQQRRITWKKKEKKKKYPTNRRGWAVFVLVSRLLCFSFHLERLPDKCIPNWKPSIYRKLLCLYENNINRILPLYNPFPCKDLRALYKVNVIVPILQTVKLNHSVKCMTSPAIKWHRFPRPGEPWHSTGSSSQQRQSETKSSDSLAVRVPALVQMTEACQDQYPSSWKPNSEDWLPLGLLPLVVQSSHPLHSTYTSILLHLCC